jgi:hypothetical protein
MKDMPKGAWPYSKSYNDSFDLTILPYDWYCDFGEGDTLKVWSQITVRSDGCEYNKTNDGDIEQCNWADTNEISKKLDEIVNEIRKYLNFAGEWKFEMMVIQDNVYRLGYANHNDENWYVVQENGKLIRCCSGPDCPIVL